MIATQGTADPADDSIFYPTLVSYNPTTYMATLTFASDLASLVPPSTVDGISSTGGFRLRIGNQYQAVTTNTENLTADPPDTFTGATPITFPTGSPQAVVIPWQLPRPRGTRTSIRACTTSRATAGCPTTNIWAYSAGMTRKTTRPRPTPAAGPSSP